MKHAKLNAYSLMASTFLLLKGNLNAEIVYVDISPDIVMDADSEVYLDIDENGTSDFRFVMHSGFFAVWGGYYSSYSFSSIELSLKSFRANGIGSNEIVSESVTSTSKGTIYYFAGMAPLSSEYPINNYAHFNASESIKHIASKQRQVTATSHVPVGDWLYVGIINPWNYNVLHGEDRYAGIRFTDEDDCLHYGWIRCAVVDSNEQLIIKDFAFETFCDWAIETGDTVGGHVSTNENVLPSATIYAAQSTVFIELLQLTENTSLQIIDISGKEIYSGIIKQQQTFVDVRKGGVYLVNINDSNQIFTKKILII